MSTESPGRTSFAVFTIGHSNLEMPDFTAMLAQHGVQLVCDVRSLPRSSRYPQFNREALEVELSAAKVKYEFCGDALGGRPADPQTYHRDGVVDYARRRKASDFCAAVDRVIQYSRTQNIALLCAEEDPLHCHRFLMICPALLERGVTPQHIRREGVLESQMGAEDRLLARHDLGAFDSGSLFPMERGAAIEDALRKQTEDYAYRSSPEMNEYF
jgi:uncharacterized protein (DUF488 family)